MHLKSVLLSICALGFCALGFVACNDAQVSQEQLRATENAFNKALVANMQSPFKCERANLIRCEASGVENEQFKASKIIYESNYVPTKDSYRIDELLNELPNISKVNIKQLGTIIKLDIDKGFQDEPIIKMLNTQANTEAEYSLDKTSLDFSANVSFKTPQDAISLKLIDANLKELFNLLKERNCQLPGLNANFSQFIKLSNCLDKSDIDKNILKSAHPKKIVIDSKIARLPSIFNLSLLGISDDKLRDIAAKFINSGELQASLEFDNNFHLISALIDQKPLEAKSLKAINELLDML